MTTTISPIPTDFVPTRRHREAAPPNYALRRVLAAALVIAALWAAITVSAAVLAGSGGAPAAASGAQPAPAAAAVHVARAGDTLWSIAERHRGDVAHGRYVDRLIALNGGTAIVVGQAVRLP